MFVVPFYTKSQLPSLIKWSLVPITLFLDNRGKQICETDEPDLWLAENGFAVKSKWREGKILYAEIDVVSTDLCWRTFYLLKAGQGETLSSTNQWNDCIDELFVEPLTTIQKRCVP